MPNIQGFSPLQIIDLANRRTDRRGEKKLDLNSELLMAIQEVCRERHWFWRRKSTSFNTQIGVPDYDLTLSNGANAPDIDQLCKRGVKLFRSTTDYVELNPLFDNERQDLALEDATQGTPCEYFVDPTSGSFQTIYLHPKPDGVYKIRVSYWAVPNITPDQLAQATSIPLVPGFFHNLVVSRLELRINKYMLGEGSAKYEASKAEYDEEVAKASKSLDFTEGRVKEWIDHRDAIRSDH